MFKPINGNVVLKRLEEKQTKTLAGLFIAKEEDERDIAEVVASDDPDVKVGERVIYAKYAPDEVEIEGEELLVCTIDDILARIDA